MAIYFDYMATTPVDPRVIEKMLGFMGFEGVFGNPSSVTHLFGQKALETIDKAREEFAAHIGASPEEIIFTSGATESNNLAILGACRFYQRQGRHLITVETEHKTVLESFRQLEREGFQVTYLPVKENGLLDLEHLRAAIKTDTLFVSVMHVNNEIGVIQDLSAIAEVVKEKGAIFHVDAAQSLGKLPINLNELPVDLMSFSSHKIYGPKGVGALYLRQKPRIRLNPISFGGGQERGLRSGTLATHQIIGFTEALNLAMQEREDEQARLLSLRNKLWQGILDFPGLRLNGDLIKRLAGNLNLTFPNIEGDDLLFALNTLAISSSSACLSSKTETSYVLKAIGLEKERIKSSIRLSLGRFTTEKDVDVAIKLIQDLKNRGGQ